MNPRSRPFSQVDVFGSRALGGNPLAVVLDADGLSDQDMARFANWTNLSETTFVLPPTTPEADYRVRIFTPSTEYPFAGHPTLGSCHAWLAAGGVPADADTVVQECGVGLVPIRRTSEGLAFAAPDLIRSGPPSQADLAAACQALGIGDEDVLESRWIDNGPGWLGLLLADDEAVRAVRPTAYAHDLDLGVVGLASAGPDAYEVRAFVVGSSVLEDPVTGSLNASVAQWLIETGRVQPPYTAIQGSALGRSGRVSISADDSGQVWVAGKTTTVISGLVEI